MHFPYPQFALWAMVIVARFAGFPGPLLTLAKLHPAYALKLTAIG